MAGVTKGRHHHNVTLLSLATRTASGNTRTADGTDGVLSGISAFSAASVLLTVGTVSGTSPTLNVYIQKKLPDDTAWMDIISFTQITASDKDYEATIVAAGNAEHVPTDASLTAGTVLTTTMGEEWSVKYVIGGTNPSFADFAVYADFYE